MGLLKFWPKVHSPKEVSFCYMYLFFLELYRGELGGGWPCGRVLDSYLVVLSFIPTSVKLCY